VQLQIPRPDADAFTITAILEPRLLRRDVHGGQRSNQDCRGR
jgi:hypothetical protein